MILLYKKYFLLFLVIFYSFECYSQNIKSFFKAPDGEYLISTDLHIHTVFSDGSVWPDVRVDEAERESLDLIAITDHLEYQPHSKDIPNPDRNRSFEIAKSHRSKKSNLIVINGAEITRSMAPGHINAVFINDANKILHMDSLSGILEANKQGAFVFWNHPNWISQRNDGIAKLDPYHQYLIKNKLLHGIEVVNENSFSEEAFEIALNNNLTVLGTSDIHGLTEWAYNISSGGHRPITFVISNSKSEKGIHNGLLNNKTFIWFNDLLIGSADNLIPVLYSNLNVTSNGYKSNTILAEIVLKNHSSVPIKLEYLGEYNLHENSKMIEIDPYSSKIILVKTKEFREKIKLPFRVLNALISSKINALISYDISI